MKASIPHTELKKGTKYLIDGAVYTYDGYSTFWNLRFMDNRGEIHIFLARKVKVYEQK